ncbi:MAG: hypothetical protein PUB21_10930 [Bacteroidales bacterium]|nr:hypothetical protein [Bacteroidales bacterium]
MCRKKTKIVLDADVIIHFIKAESFSLLPDIFPEYEYVLLDIVYKEISKDKTTQTLIDNYTRVFPKIKQEEFAPQGASMQEYFQLKKRFGEGESACMVYCRDNRDVFGSSNLKDIKEYCRQNDIANLTTLDFLYYAYCRKKLTAEECNEFIRKVRNSGSKLPDTDITRYTCSVFV